MQLGSTDSWESKMITRRNILGTAGLFAALISQVEAFTYHWEMDQTRRVPRA